MIKLFWKVCTFLCVCICLSSCQAHITTSETERPVYKWPETDSLPLETKYQGKGEMKYVTFADSYADGSGIYEDVNYWTIYIDGATIADVEGYVSQLKGAGFLYQNFGDKQPEPEVEDELAWRGVFPWFANTDACTIKIFFSKDKQDWNNSELDESFQYDLSIELLDEDVWGNKAMADE